MNPYQKKLFKGKYNQLHNEQTARFDTATQETKKESDSDESFEGEEDVIEDKYDIHDALDPDNYLKKKIEFIKQHNSSTVALKFSTEFFPETQELQKNLSIPLTVAIHPYASAYSTEDFPTTNFGPTNPVVRCDSCRGYINPFCTFEPKGQEWNCNICGYKNRVPKYYWYGLDNNMERLDKAERPELSCGTYDIKAGTDYMQRPPMPPTFLFLLDVSAQGIANGSVEIFANVLIESLENGLIPNEERARIGIIGYDYNLHVFDFNPAFKQPKVYSFSDIEENLCPNTETLVPSISESKPLILQALKNLVKLFGTNKSNDSNLIGAIKFAQKLLKKISGRIYIIQSSKNVINEKGINITGPPVQGDKKILLAPTTTIFSPLINSMHIDYISVNFFVFSNNYRNIITLGEFAAKLNGNMHYYQENTDNLVENQTKFYFEFKNSVTRDYTWESMFRIRFSKGWKASQVWGNYSIRTGDDLFSLPNVDDSQCMIYKFAYSDNPDHPKECDIFYIQSSLLFTSAKGERKMRIINYAIPCVGDARLIYSKIDSQVLAVSLFREQLSNISGGLPINNARENLISRTRDIFNAMTTKEQVARNIHPENLVTFCLNILGLLKHPILVDKTYDVSALGDFYNAWRIRFNMLSIDETCLQFAPYLFAIHTLEESTFGMFDRSGNFIFPNLIGLSSVNLSKDGIYLMDDGYSLYMMVGPDTDSRVLKILFNIENLKEAPALTEEMLYINTHERLAERTWNLISELRSRKRERYAYLHIFKQGEKSPAEFEFFGKLIEDRMSKGSVYNMSFKDFIDSMTKAVLKKI